MTELWTNTFIPWIVNVLNSSVDLQFIMDGYSCAAYIVGYVNKSNYGVSNLRRQLVQLQADHPELDFVGLMKKVCINMLNSIEMSCQEADWYLLRQPISEASCEVVFVPTMWASNRVKSHKKRERMDAEGLDAESADLRTTYEQRLKNMDDLCLANFAAWYTVVRDCRTPPMPTTYQWRVRVLKYTNCDMSEKLPEYKCEMGTLFLLFRCEHTEITDGMHFLQPYDEHCKVIVAKFGQYTVVDIVKNFAEYNMLWANVQKRGGRGCRARPHGRSTSYCHCQQ